MKHEIEKILDDNLELLSDKEYTFNIETLLASDLNLPVERVRVQIINPCSVVEVFVKKDSSNKFTHYHFDLVPKNFEHAIA